MSSPYSVTVDQASLARAKKTLDKYRGRGLQERMRRGTLQAARMLVGPVRSAAPLGPTGNLKRSVKAWTRGTYAFGMSTGKSLSAGVGPAGRLGAHRHLVIQGHRIVTPGGRDTGRRTQGNPFVDSAANPRIDDAIREVSKILFGP